MTKQELINKLEKDPIEEYVYGTDVDPLVVEGKLNLILKFLKEGDSRGTDVMFDGVYQEIVNFISDPQAQIDSLKSSIAANVDGIAHVEQIKQDKLPQVDLDNIASINQMKDDITELDKQVTDKTDLTTLASKVETNTSEISKKLKGNQQFAKNIERIVDNHETKSFLYNGNYAYITFFNGDTQVQRIGCICAMITCQGSNIIGWYFGREGVIKQLEVIPLTSPIKINFGASYMNVIEFGGVK